MFYYFFQDYKESVYKASLRKLAWYEVLMLAAFVACVIWLVLCLSLNTQKALTITAFILMLASLAAIAVYAGLRNRNQREQRRREYKENRIEGLIRLLKSPEYNLYDEESVDWLIACCKNKRANNEGYQILQTGKRFFSMVLFPIITLCLGLILKDLSTKEILFFAGFCGAVLLFLFGIAVMIQPAFTYLMDPDQTVNRYLEDELGYIRTQIHKL